MSQQRGGSSGGGGSGMAMVRPPVDKAADFANYFCTYSFLYHQKEMLSDRVRMDAYYTAILQNPTHFVGKVVLDVGTGSGILAIWAAKAGAARVYAVEATNMAQHARQLVIANKVDNIVQVIEGSMEEVHVPEKVDVIISEWMGYFLLRESMFDSVIHARDHYLKPTGVMYPSHARMWIAPIKSKHGQLKLQDHEKAMADWQAFVDETFEYYNVDMSILNHPFEKEQEKYYLQTSIWDNLYPSQIIGTPTVIKEFDCHTATLEDISSVHSPFRIPLTGEETNLCGFAGWFDVSFKGSQQEPALYEVELSTAPSVHDTTHWGQQVFLMEPPRLVRSGEVLEGSIDITRSKENHRLMDLQFTSSVRRPSGEITPPLTSHYFIE